ncbi:MAG: hypothetical protein ACOZCE_11805 [Spirochaetota bacterium]
MPGFTLHTQTPPSSKGWREEAQIVAAGPRPMSQDPLASGNGTRGWRNNHGDYGDPMVVHARTPNNVPPPEGPRQFRRTPSDFL